MNKMSRACVVCDKASTLICPECSKLGLPIEISSFCSQECFKSVWKSHKKNHKINIKTVEGLVTDGVVLKTTNDLGRILIAMKDFSIGEIVFSEFPILTWNKKSKLELLTKFSQLGEEEKNTVLDFYHVKSENEASYQSCISRLNSHRIFINRSDMQSNILRLNITAETAVKILCITDFNSHSFRGNEAYSEVVNGDPDSAYSALFPLGSKVSHSCQPNCCYTSKSKPDRLSYYAITSIRKGDIISFSYIDTYKPTQQRREELIETKDFLCQCIKCIKPDYMSGICCGDNNCTGVKFCTYSSLTERTWACDVCCSCSPPDLTILTTIYSKFENFENEILNCVQRNQLIQHNY